MKKQTIIRILQGILCTTALYTPQAMAAMGEILGETILPIVGIIFLIVATIHIIQKIITYHKQHIAPCCNMWKKSTDTGTDAPAASTDTPATGTDTTITETTTTPKRTGKKGRPKKSATKTAGTKTQTKTISKGKRGRPRKSTAKKPMATTTTATEPPNNESEQ